MTTNDISAEQQELDALNAARLNALGAFEQASAAYDNRRGTGGIVSTTVRAGLDRLERERRAAWELYCVTRDRYDRERRELLRQLDQDNKEKAEREEAA